MVVAATAILFVVTGAKEKEQQQTALHGHGTALLWNGMIDVIF